VTLDAEFNALRRMESLREVSDASVLWLAEHVEDVQFQPGDQFISEGHRTRDCFFLVSGEADVTRGGQRLGLTGPGEPEGEVALFLRVPRTATTTAITVVDALRLPSEAYDAVQAEDPRIAEDLRIGLCRHLARRFGLHAFAGVALE
jgi:voltage-gated potassium channel